MDVPERIGRYQVLGVLGQGAMGTVYRGRDDRLERDVALKVMSKGLADPDSRARFEREAKAAAKLQHPNIVVIYELGEHEGAPFMALELLEGVDLQRGIDYGIRPDPRTTLPVVLQLLDGLGHAHEHGIVHRDVKPSNVFLPLGRPAKIMDFGVARLAGIGTTTSGVVVGTANYMSPEQASAGEIDGRSDLFSAGLILYELVTGEKAYKADSFVAMLYKIVHEPPDLSLIPEGCEWERLRAVLTRALARQADDRYPDARAMSADLSQALVELGGTVDRAAPADQALLVRPRPVVRMTHAVSEAALPIATSAAPAPAPARVSARLPWLVARAGAAALVAIAAIAGWLWLRPGELQPLPSLPSPSLPSPSQPLPSLPSPSLPSPPPESKPRSAVVAVEPSSSPPAAIPPAALVAPTPTPRAAPTATTTPSPAAPTPGPTTTPAPSPTPAAVPTPASGLGSDARLARAEALVALGRWPEALAESRAVLEVQPRNARATALAQQAEAEIVIEDCLQKARAALQEGERDRALEELRRGFLVRGNDPRLLALHREAVQQ
jgi:serine/threonine protein kinase